MLLLEFEGLTASGIALELTGWDWKKGIHPGRFTWNTRMEVVKMVFLCKRVIATFRVNFQGCKLLMHGDASTQRILQVCNCWLSMWGCSTCSPLSDFSFPRNTGFMRLFLGDMEGNLSSPLFRPCFWGVTLKNYDCKRSREATHLKVSMLCKWTVEKCKLNLVWKKHVFPQEIANTWFQLITSKFVHPSYPAAFSCNWYLPKKQT